MGLGFERRCGNESMTRHMHGDAGVAIVLSGGYEEAGDRGRFDVRAGDVVVHAPFDTHLDHFIATGAQILNLPVSFGPKFRAGFGRVSDPDLIVQVAERDLPQAVELIFSAWEEHPFPALDWPEQLAQELGSNPELCLGDWAREIGLAAATVTRGFKQVFGITPSRFRSHIRAKLAWEMVTGSDARLCNVAADLGFADQAHMTRALRSLTGQTPSRCRASGQIDSRQTNSSSL